MASTLSKKCSIAAVSALVVGGATLLAVPGHAVSAGLVFVCNTPVGDKEFITVADTDLPATMVAGATAPVNATATVTIPADLSELAYGFLGARTVDGTAVVKSTLDGVAIPVINKTVASTPVPATGPLTVTAVGTASPYTATVGTHVIKAVSYTASLSFKDADGVEKIKVDTTCIPKVTDPAQDLTVDTVTVAEPTTPPTTPPTTAPTTAPTTTPTVAPVAKADTSTTARAKYAAATKKATVKVAVKAATGSATGAVKVTLKQGVKKVRAIVVNLSAGKARAVFKKIAASGKYKVTVAYAGSSTTNASSARTSFKVS